jgi:methylamine utilization protein MauE
MRYLVLFAAVTLGEVFAVSLIGKLPGRTAHPAYVRATGDLLPARAASAAGPVALGVLVAEGVAVVLLVLAPVLGLSLAAGLLFVFTIALTGALRRGSRTACRCFGASSRPIGPVQIVRNLLLAVVAVSGAVAAAAGPGAGLPTGPELGAASVTVLAATVFAVLMVAAEDLADLLLPGRI